MRAQRFAILPVLTVFLAAGCSHVPRSEKDPHKLLGYACGPGAKTEAVSGSVSMSAKSKDASGRFPAMIKAQAPDHLTIEVTNLIGTTQALIQVEGARYTITAPDPKTKQMRKRQEGIESWGGIPLRWATDLFLGKIPCPTKEQLVGARLGQGGSAAGQYDPDELAVETAPGVEQEKERFIYHFRDWGGIPWPESLHWERFGAMATSVDFKFDTPDDRTHSPGKWEAKSPQGEVKVRWSSREITSAS